ncbi:unnamed protein product, partial [Prorocentrum cordatum]
APPSTPVALNAGPLAWADAAADVRAPPERAASVGGDDSARSGSAPRAGGAEGPPPDGREGRCSPSGINWSQTFQTTELTPGDVSGADDEERLRNAVIAPAGPRRPAPPAPTAREMEDA